MSAQSNAPIIVRRKKVIAAAGHHGGAWKVAYADFVTAMMAFFLLMWLLGATTENQRKGIADYFNPTIPINRTSGGGDGAFGGTSVFSENSMSQNGTGAGARQPTAENQAKGASGVEQDDAEADKQVLEEVQAVMAGMGGESMVSELLSRHIVSHITDEGLIVEVFDIPDLPLFEPGTAEPTQTLIDIAEAITAVFALVSNEIAVEGHVAARPVVVAESRSWSLSSDRANAARRLIEDAGIAERRIVRVTGHADRENASGNPLSDRNNRIELILLRSKL